MTGIANEVTIVNRVPYWSKDSLFSSWTVFTQRVMTKLTDTTARINRLLKQPQDKVRNRSYNRQRL